MVRDQSTMVYGQPIPSCQVRIYVGSKCATYHHVFMEGLSQRNQERSDRASLGVSGFSVVINYTVNDQIYTR